jgi:molybdate transport system substrate-binding protein
MSWRLPRRGLLLGTAGLWLAPPVVARDRATRQLTVAAAADLRFALDELLQALRAAQPDLRIEVIYGSSGKIATQIRHGAPFDVFLSADVAYARDLHTLGLAAGPPRLYAVGRLATWSLQPALGRLALDDLVRHPDVRKLAIANPEHAPYGQRAVEALRARGVYDEARPKLVLGENVAQAAQFVDTGAAQAGIVAYSLVLAPALASKGAWTLLPQDWHQRLDQGLVVLRRAAANPAAAAFVKHMESPSGREVLRRYGFVMPVEAARS